MSVKHEGNTVTVQLQTPASLSADTWTKYVDLAGFSGVTITVSSEMSTADGSNYFTPVFKDATATPGSTGSYSSTGADNLVGAFSAMNSTTGYCQSVSYIGTSRYVAVLLDETSTAAGVFSVTATLFGPKESPATNHTPTTGAVS